MKLLILLFSLFSIFTISASTSSTADTAPQPMTTSTSSVAQSENRAGANISIVIPNNLQDPNLQDFVYLAGVYPFLLNPDNQVCVVLPVIAMKSILNSSTTAVNDMVDMIQSMQGYTAGIPAEITEKDCLKKIREMAEETFPGHWDRYQQKDEKRNITITCRMIEQAINKSYRVFMINEQFIALVPHALLGVTFESCVAKRTRYSVGELLEEHGLNIKGLSEVSNLKSLEAPELKSTMTYNSLSEVLQKLLFSRDDNTCKCKIMFYGHGLFKEEKPEEGILVGMKRDQFKAILELLNDKSVAEVGYKTCHTGEQLPEIEALQLKYDLAAIVDSGLVWVEDGLDSYFPLRRLHLQSFLKKVNGKYVLCPKNRLFLSQIFNRITSGDLSTNLQTGGVKAAGEKEFVPKGADLTPLKRIIGKFEVRTVADEKGIYPAKQYVVEPVVYAANAGQIASKYLIQIYNTISLQGVTWQQFLKRLVMDQGKMLCIEQLNLENETVKDVIVTSGDKEFDPKIVYYTSEDGSKWVQNGLRLLMCDSDEDDAYTILRDAVLDKKINLGIKVGAKRKLELPLKQG